MDQLPRPRPKPPSQTPIFVPLGVVLICFVQGPVIKCSSCQYTPGVQEPRGTIHYSPGRWIIKKKILERTLELCYDSVVVLMLPQLPLHVLGNMPI